MIPKASAAINNIVARIATDLAPRAPDAYAASDLGFISVLLMVVGQDFDRAADVLVTEHDEISALLAAARPHLPDLADQIDAALAHAAPSLRIPDLNARADVTLTALIAVHAAVEIRTEDWAQALNLRIWRFLDGFAARRAYDVPM